MEDADFRDAECEDVFGGGHLAEMQEHEGVLTLDCDREVCLKRHTATTLRFWNGFGGR